MLRHVKEPEQSALAKQKKKKEILLRVYDTSCRSHLAVLSQVNDEIEKFVTLVEPFVPLVEPFVALVDPFVALVEPFVPLVEPFVAFVEPFVALVEESQVRQAQVEQLPTLVLAEPSLFYSWLCCQLYPKINLPHLG